MANTHGLDDQRSVNRQSRRGPRQNIISSKQSRGLYRIHELVPTKSQLEALVYHGRIILPKHYRRGMYLDIIV